MPHEIKVNGYKPSKWPSRPEMNVDAHEKPAVQPDWEQNDESQPDYIKSRPFYEVTTDTLLDLTIQNWRSMVIGLGTYACSWCVAGVDYIDVMPTSHEGCAVQQYELGNETVVVVLNGQSRIYSVPSDADVHLLIRKTDIKQIDQKFIPNGLPVINQNIQNGYVPTTHSAGEEIAQYEMHRPIRVYNIQRVGQDQDYSLYDDESNEKVTPVTIDFTGTPVVLTLNDRYLYQTGPGGMYRYFVSLTTHDVKRNGIYVKGYYEVELNLRMNSVSVSEHVSDIQKIRIAYKNNDGTVSFCGILASKITLADARSAYNEFRPYLTFNGEPFITAELTDSSITIVYMGKGEDGQYGVQKTTFGGITWKSETT